MNGKWLEKGKITLLNEVKYALLKFFASENDEKVTEKYIFLAAKPKILPLGITNIDIIKEKDNLSIIITLEFPGLLIEKAGSRLDKLIKFLEDVLKYPIKIRIIESTLWKVDYSKIKFD